MAKYIQIKTDERYSELLPLIKELVFEITKKLGLANGPTIIPSSGGVAESRGGHFPSHPEPNTKKAYGYRNTRNYMSLPYNPKLKERARKLRKAGYLSEILFWKQVRNKQFKGYDFDRQKIIGNYIVDFYCTNCNVVIEVDGSSHDHKQEYDAKRDAFLESLGLTVIHIPVEDVMNNLKGVMEMLFIHPALKGTPPEEGRFTSQNLLDYIYAVFHSPGYREKYIDFMQLKFPTVPYPKNQKTFLKLVKLGGELRQIHLLESLKVDEYIAHYTVDGNNVVVKPRFENDENDENVGKVFINETQYFENVPVSAWNFYIGSYQPAQKWLKDRKERVLEFDDIIYYQKIIVALSETDRLMKEIEKIEVE